MNLKDILMKKLVNYHWEKDGLYYNDTLISYCNVVIEKIITYYYPNGKQFRKYFVKAIMPDNTECETKELSSFNNFSCFELWQCPDINQKGKNLIKEMLELKSALTEAQEAFICQPGLQKCNGQSLYILGDKIIGAKKLTEKIILETVRPYSALHNRERNELLNLAERAIKILPGTSEIVFYYSLEAIVKLILHEIGIDTNYTLAITGPSGHLKTSIAKKFCLWLQDKSSQQTTFSSKKTTKRILEDMDTCSGLNYLVDDFHEYAKTQDMDRQEKRLDDIVRHVEENPSCANIVITGEFIQGIFSCIDRLLVIQIPEMIGEELKELKARLTNIPDNLMPEVAYVFAQALLDNLEEVEQKCFEFYQTNYLNTKAEYADATRTFRHSIFLQLTEFLYRTYICSGSKEISRKNDLDMAIKKQYEIQQNQLRRIKADEDCDYVLKAIEMLNANNQYITIVTDRDSYYDYERSCLQNNDKIYITRNALLYGMVTYLKRRINMNRMIRQLEDAGLLSRSTDSITKKLNGKRHYVITLTMIKLYSNCKMG